MRFSAADVGIGNEVDVRPLVVTFDGAEFLGQQITSVFARMSVAQVQHHENIMYNMYKTISKGIEFLLAAVVPLPPLHTASTCAPHPTGIRSSTRESSLRRFVPFPSARTGPLRNRITDPTPHHDLKRTRIAHSAVFSKFSMGQSARHTISIPSSLPFRENGDMRLNPRVEMIATDRNRRLEIATLDEIVDRLAHLGTLTVTEPADARRQSLEVNAIARQTQPAIQRAIVRKHLEREIVGLANVSRIA
jgi:hypothetical protein